MKEQRTIVGGVRRHKETPGEIGDVELHHGIIEEAPDCMTRVTQGSIAETGTFVEPILASGT